MDRRKFLASMAVGSVTALAGCGVEVSGSSESQVNVSTSTQTPSPTQSSPPSQTPTSTPSPTPGKPRIGEKQVLSNGIGLTVTGIEMLSDHDRASDSENAFHVDVTAVNQGSSTQSAPLYMNFYLLTEEEQFGPNEYDTTYHDNTQDLLPEKSGSGYILYIIPGSVEKSDLEQVALVDDGLAAQWYLDGA